MMSSSGSTRAKMGEVKLFENSKERDQVESLAQFYATIKTTDLLEAAYSRDAIKDGEYAEACSRLISQFKNHEKVLVRSGAIASAEAFFKEYDVDCPRAYERLLVSGVPATVVHPTADSRAESVLVAETVHAFITAMDGLKLGQKYMDEVQPIIADVSSSLARLHSLPADFEGLTKMRFWLEKLHQMRATDQIDENDVRQLLFDLESSYDAFHRYLSSRK